MNASGERFKRQEHILKRADFERAYTSGSRIHSRFMTVFVMPNGGSHARLGVAATRKMGPAVDRNRAKRLAREIFRRHKLGEGLDVVVVPRREMLDAPFSSLEADYIAALGKRHTAPRATGGARRPHRSKPAPRNPRV